jgi:arylsulfatase A-like enzyme
MARLTDPWEVIRRQAEPREAFDLGQIIDLYDGCVRCFDDEAARLLAYLDACGAAANTIVVIYSDHGMEFFEHDTWGQGNSAIGDQSPRIPLIISDPRRPTAVTIPEVVRTIDLVPTLLELAGVHTGDAFDGVSLQQYLTDPNQRPDLPAFNETGIWLTEVPGMAPEHLHYPDLFEILDVPDRDAGTITVKPEYEGLVLRAKDRMMRTNQWKLVYQPLLSGYRLLLYDVIADAACRRDVADKHPDAVAELWPRLRAWIPASELNTHAAS